MGSENMEMEEKKSGEVYIIVLKGRLDAYSSNELEKKVDTLIDQGCRKLVVNFGDVDYISSSGLRVMLSTLKKLQKMGGDVKLAGLKPYVREVFDISGFTQLFDIHNLEEEAIKSF
jgi:anti-sigma B factor antagonist